MRYFQILAWEECPYCIQAKELLIKKEEQHMFCTFERSDKLLSFYKQKYKHNTVPLILLKDTSVNFVKFIGGFTDLENYIGDKDGKS